MGSRRKQTTDLRSGHIKADNVSETKQLKIIKRNGVFRVYNTGADDFAVKPSSQAPIPLKKKGSVDFEVNGEVVIDRAAEGPVKGIYECIDIPTPIRSGRFKGPANGLGITIVQNRNTTFYRILNSSKQVDNDFEVRFGGPEPAILAPKMSIDVAALPNITIFRSTSQPVIGIYDYLDVENVVQSGRFSIQMASSARHKIIDFRGGNKRAFYRILNSGEAPFVVRLGVTMLTTVPLHLEPEQSLDFEVPASGEQIVTVAPVGGTKLIEGIYEFFGQV